MGECVIPFVQTLEEADSLFVRKGGRDFGHLKFRTVEDVVTSLDPRVRVPGLFVEENLVADPDLLLAQVFVQGPGGRHHVIDIIS